MQFSGFFLLIFYFSLLKYTYHYNYRSHIPLQVGKLAKSAGGQILIFPTVYAHTPPLQSYFPNSAPVQHSVPPNSSADNRTQNAGPLSTINTSDLTHTPVEGMGQFSFTQALFKEA